MKPPSLLITFGLHLPVAGSHFASAGHVTPLQRFTQPYAPPSAPASPAAGGTHTSFGGHLTPLQKSTQPASPSQCLPGAQVVLAVNLLSESTGLGGVMMDPPEPAGSRLAPSPDSADSEPTPAARGGFFRRPFSAQETGAPGIAAVMADAFNITQDRISRARLAGDPPDVLLSARLGKIGMFEFHRAAEMIDIGRDAVRRALPDIRAQISAVAGTG